MCPAEPARAVFCVFSLGPRLLDSHNLGLDVGRGEKKNMALKSSHSDVTPVTSVHISSANTSQKHDITEGGRGSEDPSE